MHAGDEDNMRQPGRRTVLGFAGATAAGMALYSATDLLNGEKGNASESAGVSTPQFTKLTPFLNELRIPPTLRPKGSGVMTVDIVERRVRLHAQIPLTPLWTYEGHFPGPTIETRRGQRIRIAWANKLHGGIPVRGVWVPPSGPGLGVLPYNTPGAPDGTSRPEVANLTGWTSVHLHGGDQHAISDGSPDSAVTPGSAQLAEYPGDLEATHLFYHDHAMPVTALNVLAGLAGHYIVRDEQEDRLGLPKGDQEIPLAIADVNFDTDANGRLTGQILAKRIVLDPAPSPGTMPTALQFMGPYTMVNGVVWPYLSVEARRYRFRVLNIALSRSYRLVVVDEETGQPVRGAMTLIGTDMGLLDKPVVIDEALSLSPAERADILIDFSAFPGKRLKLVNTVPNAPAGTPVPPAALAYPDVMQFRVEQRQKSSPRIPTTLSGTFKRLTADDIPQDVVERFVMLAWDKTGLMPQIWELKETDALTPQGDGVVQLALAGGQRTFRRSASVFEDAPNFFAAAQSWEKWTFISVGPPNLPVVHPMHIHAIKFQVLERYSVDGSGLDPTFGGTRRPITVKAKLPIVPEESGWKDTVAVTANSMVTVLGHYGKQTGRYMYHCHVLDHEDEGMMRPILVMPSSVLDIHHMMSTMSGDGGTHEAVPAHDHH